MTTVIHPDPIIIAAVVGVFIPLATELATKLQASSGVRAVVALGLSAITGVVSTVAGQGNFEPKTAGLAIASAFVANLSAYIGAWKPIGANSRAPGAGLLPNVGFGAAAALGRPAPLNALGTSFTPFDVGEAAAPPSLRPGAFPEV
jgi:hypothetical protein